MIITLTDGSEVTTWAVPIWSLWAILALVWIPILAGWIKESLS
jgi:hypothetical protein